MKRKSVINSYSEDTSLFIRNFLFGVEDSLISTVGLLSGVAAGGAPRQYVFLTGVVLIFVEAFSMAVGSYLSEDFADEVIEHSARAKVKALMGATIMFFSYFSSGFIPLSPYVIFDVRSAFWLSIVFSLVALFMLGTITAKLFHAKVLFHGMKMLILGGMAISVGYLVGKMLSV